MLRRAWGQKNHPLPVLNEMAGLQAFETTPWGQGGSPQAKLAGSSRTRGGRARADTLDPMPS